MAVLSSIALEQVLKYAVPRRCMTSKGGTAYGWFAAESGLNWDRSNAMILASGNIPVEVRNELDVMAIAKIIFPVDNPPGSGGVRFATKKEAIEALKWAVSGIAERQIIKGR